MARIHVLGGTGYSGERIAAEALSRGHDVTISSRRDPAVVLPGVRHEIGSVTRSGFVADMVIDADVIISAVSPRGDTKGKLRPALGLLAKLARVQKKRVGIIGDAGSLLVASGGPRVMDSPRFPATRRDEATEMAGVLDDFRGHDAVDWFYVSPAADYGAARPGVPRGSYRVGTDELLVDELGQSFISGADLAKAVVDEIESPRFSQSRFTVAY